MADAVINVLSEQLADILVEQLKEKVTLVTEVKSQVESLTSDLKAIGDVALDAEKKQLSYQVIKRWLASLKDASYDVETLLDEWTTAIARAKLESGEESRDEIGETKVCFSLIFCCFNGSKGSQEILRRLNIAERIRGLKVQIEEINKRKAAFKLETTPITEEDRKWRDTNSDLGVVVYGQDDEKKSLIEQLSEKDGKIRFICVTGMGGIGKTTLAKNVYNDKEVQKEFRRRLWVCVSQPFDLERIAREVVEQLTGRALGGSVGRQTLMTKFREEIGQRKFLLILDDVWTHNYNEWEPLERALAGGKYGNRVIVTTRSDDVMRMIGEDRVIRVEKLSENNCWLLLKEVASVEVDADLERIGKHIARKCDGLPLAAKTLGGILRCKRTKEEWIHVYKSELWELPNVEENIFRPLLLSYYDLQPVERRCFLYCAVFPKDHRMKKDDLVHQWMAQGYFYSNKRADIEYESIGQECFKSLAMRSLFQDLEYDDVSRSTIKSCMMHDIVHDFAQSLTRDEFDVISINGIPERLDFNGRHLNLKVHSDHFGSDLIPNPMRLYTFMVSMPDVSRFTNGVSRFKALRSLTLSLCYGSHLPDDIGELIHLRYLCLSAIAQRITLPATINDLFNLQTLRLGSSATLPPLMGKLVNLRHIYSPIDDHKFPWPNQISKLKALRTMEVLKCGDGDDEFHLRDLGQLNNLRRLWIQEIGRTQEDEDGAVRAGLINKTKLRELELDFFAPYPNLLNSIHKSVLKALKPCESLRNLRINDYGGPAISLTWIMTLKNLVRLELTSCQSCKSLPPLGKLPGLESLTISRLTSLESLEDELECQSDRNVAVTLFPKLKNLKLDLLRELLQWNRRANASGTTMPVIENLCISHCSSLKSLPRFPEMTPLKKLVIERCPDLATACQEGTGSEWHKIRNVPDIQILQ